MAIRSDALGGTDWGDGEVPSATDLNDTIDAAITKIQTLSAFWLNSDLYDVYDDFSAYSTGAFVTNTNWTIGANVGTASSTVTIENASFTKTSGKELKVITNGDGGFNSSSREILTKLNPANKHTTVNFGFSAVGRSESNAAHNLTISVGNLTDGYTNIFSVGENYYQFAQVLSSISIVAKGNNTYDTYWGIKKISSDLSKPNGIQIKFNISVTGYATWNTILYIGLIYNSKGTI